MTQRVREGAEQVGKKTQKKPEAASPLPNVPKACSDRAKQGLEVRKEEVVVAGGVRGQGLEQEGEASGPEPHEAAQALRPNPASYFSRLRLSSAPAWLWHRIHTTVPASVNKESPQMPTSPTAVPCPARGSPHQHPASSVIHSDAQLDFLFVFYIVDTPLVTPVRPSKEMLRAWRRPCHTRLHVVFPGTWIQ